MSGEQTKHSDKTPALISAAKECLNGTLGSSIRIDGKPAPKPDIEQQHLCAATEIARLASRQGIELDGQTLSRLVQDAKMAYAPKTKDNGSTFKR